MWRCLILTLCATGISAFVVEPYNASINSPVEHRQRSGRQNGIIKRFACPIGFFRLKRYCYYLSAGTASWRDAYFHCKDRNATLAILDRNGKDRMLRKYLMGEPFTKLERWIGGIFNWRRMAWEWGVTGEKMEFRNFGKPQSDHSRDQYAWHCITIDPALKYKWSPRSCVERKHYVCEVPAGRIARRRKKTADPFAPQNQTLKPRKKGKKYSDRPQNLKVWQNKPRQKGRRNWAEQNADSYWRHGVNLGSRPPSNVKTVYPKNRMRHRSNRTRSNYSVGVPQVTREKQYDAFLDDGPISSHDGLQSLTDKGNSQFPRKITDFASEEILLRP